MQRATGPTSQGISSLATLGLTAVEAEAYAFLVRAGPATGYRIAQEIGRPVGNLYKSLESLGAKGFVLSADEEGGRLYRAVPVREVGAKAVREVERAAARAAAELAGRAAARADDRLYAITERGATIERARAMIAEASDFVLATACPAFASELGDVFTGAAARHVAVGLKVYAPVELAGVRVVQDERGERAWREGPGQWMVLSVDGRSMLTALLDHEGDALRTAQWSENPMLNWAMYTGQSSDLLLAEARAMIGRGVPGPEAMRSLDALHRLETPVSGGKSELRRRYGATSGAGKRGRS